MGNPNFIDKLSTALSPSARRGLEAITARAHAAGLRAYIVGGPVRDLLLGRASLDLDIVVEGDAIALARAVAPELEATVRAHPAFGTASLRFEGTIIDIATARRETYDRPGALPRTHPADVEADLLRRDFTVNAIALALTGSRRGAPLDPTGGRADLRAGLLRVLHDESFRDDATRIIRAARYETRFTFRLEERTLDLLLRDLPYLDTISGARLRQELARTLEEAEPEHTLRRLDTLGVLSAIEPALRFTDAQAAAFARLRKIAPHTPAAARWALLAWDMPDAALPRLAQRLALPARARDAVLALAAVRRVAAELGTAAKPSRIAGALEALPSAAVWALAAAGTRPAASEAALVYLTRLQRVRPTLRGDDIIRLGVQRGPPVGEMLRRLRVAKLDGEVPTKSDEERYVRRALQAKSKRR